jgi:hypothetical protein
MANKGMIDKDLGLANIFKEMEKLKSMSAKVGLPEGSGEHDGVDIATYAAWNELGVMKKDGGGWAIPPRPFMRTAADAKREQIGQLMAHEVGKVADGKQTAKEAIDVAAEGLIGLIKQTIQQGPWEKNSEITIHGTNPKIPGKRRKSTYQFIKGKGSSKPLIDTGTMKNSIQAVILKNGVPIDRIKKE